MIQNIIYHSFHYISKDTYIFLLFKYNFSIPGNGYSYSIGIIFAQGTYCFRSTLLMDFILMSSKAAADIVMTECL